MYEWSGFPVFSTRYGYSGVGKTSLIKEIYKPILEERTFLIRKV